MIYIMVAINILLLVSGQLLWKIGMEKIENVTIVSLIQAIFTPYIFGGIILYGIATLLWLWILSKAEFSIVYPLQSLAYAAGVVLAIAIFKEQVPMIRWVGVGMIILGAFLIARS
jgi:drug/metabolite transporter (DMT)-like permease